MSGPGFEPAGSGSTPQSSTDAEQQSSESQADVDRSLLERVVRETVAGDEQADAISPAEMDALRGVAKRHAGAPFALDPVAVDLVECVISSRLAEQELSDQRRRSMSVEIATSLMETPVVEARLRRFWGLLSRSVA